MKNILFLGFPIAGRTLDSELGFMLIKLSSLYAFTRNTCGSHSSVFPGQRGSLAI